MPNARNLVEQAKISPYHIGTWAYVYTIGYRSDLLKGVNFESWADLWKPEIKGKLAAPDFDPSHIIAVAAMLSGGDAATWEKGQAKLKELKPSFKAFYTNDANSQQLIANGETPVQVILSMNAHYMAGEGVPIQLVIPKEGAVLGIDTVAIMKGTKKAELAYKFINIDARSRRAGRDRQVQEGQPGGRRCQARSRRGQAPRRVHDRRPVEQPGHHHRPQAARGEDAEWRKWFAENIMN